MIDLPNISPQDQARILSEALPHMQQYDEETIVIKYGGHAMGEENLAKQFARDIVLLEQTAINPVVVHGGGPQIAAMLSRLGIKSEFAAGLRVTDAPTMEIVEMVLAGSINKSIVSHINEAGGKAVGLCGKDGNMVTATKATRTMVDPGSNIEKVVDLGFVGEPDKVDLTLQKRAMDMIWKFLSQDTQHLYPYAHRTQKPAFLPAPEHKPLPRSTLPE